MIYNKDEAKLLTINPDHFRFPMPGDGKVSS